MRSLPPLLALGVAVSSAAAWAAPVADPAAAPVAAPVAVLPRLDGSTIRSDEIDAFVAQQIKAEHVTGLGLAIIAHGEVVYVKTFGDRDAAHHLPLQPDTVMYGASFTKAVFGALIASLADDKVLDLDRPVIELLGKSWAEVPRFTELAGDPRAGKITSRMLISHTAGFANLRYLEPDGRLRLHFDPGTAYAYSGEGINLLQLVVEQVTGHPVGDLIRERVLEPLGMSRTSLVWQAQLADNTAIGYDRNGRALGHEQRPAAHAAGSMDTTIADFAAFVAAMVRGKVISGNAKKLLLTPAIEIRYAQQFPTLRMTPTHDNDRVGLAYGLGWGLLTKTPYGVGYFKEGHDDGWGAYALAFDKPGIAVVVMTNSDNGERVFRPILEKVIHDDVTPWAWEGYP
ncbi:MAG TPA: serine hydrolase domain-containing protein [Kofleriaceae bacterium]|jgi:CubicO group peptidase (beta-lactamase class C family)|nr:serine hydrolase domain-containing protein [Kofleriaceae bacterium]